MLLIRLAIFLLLPLATFCQRQCTGIIIDKITGNRIPYSTVGLTRENKGVSANEQGIFSILSSYTGDSLRISSVGYKTQVISISNWVNGSVVSLLQEEYILKEVAVSSNSKKQEYVLNSLGHCSSNWYQIGLETFYQLAQRFDAPEQGMQLKGVEICKDPSECIFRLRIYDADSLIQCPSKDLVDTIIEVRSNDKRVQIDLLRYNVIMPGKTFFIAIEWLFIPFNEGHEKIKQNGKKTDWTFYKPALRFVRDQDVKSGDVWILGFNGRWIENTRADRGHNFQISAMIK